MSISIDALKKMADMSRIYVPDEAVEGICAEINTMFEFVSQIAEVDVTGVEPLVNVVDHDLKMRADVVTEQNNVEAIMNCAPLSQENFFLVPKVVE